MGLKGKPKFSQRQWHIKTTHCKEHMGTRERNKRLVRPGGFGGGTPPNNREIERGKREKRGERGKRNSNNREIERGKKREGGRKGREAEERQKGESTQLSSGDTIHVSNSVVFDRCFLSSDPNH